MTRPVFYSLSPDEQAQNEAERQGRQGIGFLDAILLALSPVLVIAAAQITLTLRGL